MHKFIFPSVDSFMWNHPDFKLKNFGRDEILEVESKTYTIKTFVSESAGSAVANFVGLSLLNFVGSFTGSLTGSGNVTGSIIGCGMVLPASDSC